MRRNALVCFIAACTPWSLNALRPIWARVPLAVPLTCGAAAVLFGCSPQTDSQTAQAVSRLSERFDQLDARIARLEATPASGDPWIMWHAETNLKNALNGTWPTAEAGYPTKQDCLSDAGRWSLPNGQQVGNDPVIWENKEWRMTLRCLPKGVDPIQRH